MPRKKKTTRVLMYDDLVARGIKFGRQQLRNLWRSGDFPPPTYLTARRLVWPEDVIEKWLKDRIAAPEEKRLRRQPEPQEPSSQPTKDGVRSDDLNPKRQNRKLPHPPGREPLPAHGSRGKGVRGI